jgi:hypothetical protein
VIDALRVRPTIVPDGQHSGHGRRDIGLTLPLTQAKLHSCGTTHVTEPQRA